MMQAVGIDLGTGNSVVAVYRRGRPEVLNVEGESIMPSVVATHPGGGLLIGRSAKRRALIDPENSVVAIKREMGNRDFTVTLDGKPCSPVDVSGIILRKLVESASEQLGGQVKDAVISVPAYFTNNQKEDTRQAGEKAGLNVLRLIPEPTAAAVAYGANRGTDQTILVYDLGAGTFDVSVLEVKGNQFNVKGIGGDHQLGGEDFDRCMIELILQQLRKDVRLGKHLSEADPERLAMQLKESAEAAKKELSSADTTDVEIPDLVPGSPVWLTITRAEFERTIASLVDRTIAATADTIKRAGLSPDDIDRVVLVGGSTRVPMIQQRIAEKVRDPFISDYVDQVVALGAAIAASSYSVAEEHVDKCPVEIKNIAAHSLGIRAAKDKFSILVPRGTPLPVDVHKTFTTAVANASSTDVEVFQGENELCSNNQQLGGFQMVGIQRAPAGTPKIDVGFSLDEDDILTVTASDATTGTKAELVIEKFETKPYEPAEDRGKSLESLRIGVSPTGCDDAGAILNRLRLPFTLVKNRAFRNQRVVSQYDVLFINCLCDLTQVAGPGMVCSPRANKKALNEFVTKGGVLYVSDFAYQNITEIFPGRIRFSKDFGQPQLVSVDVVDPEIQAFTGPKTTVDFNTIYIPVASVTNDCTVYMIKDRKEPVLVSFPHGDGHVVYTAFHNTANISDKLAEVIKYVILRTISLATKTPLVELAESDYFRRK